MHFEDEAKVQEASEKLDNALVRQKDTILALINNEGFKIAVDLLAFSYDLWMSCDYGYKYEEIKKRILTECKEKDREVFRSSLAFTEEMHRREN